MVEVEVSARLWTGTTESGTPVTLPMPTGPRAPWAKGLFKLAADAEYRWEGIRRWIAVWVADRAS